MKIGTWKATEPQSSMLSVKANHLLPPEVIYGNSGFFKNVLFSKMTSTYSSGCQTTGWVSSVKECSREPSTRSDTPQHF
ncbi:hypothetical protein B9Z55_022112 [Caenorhabditis nigoni]|uniref:Uncharacterized protein n=1 Tax=Caenorhabditis nigoni TaxID=1611254 RepID=A0A2G5TVW8_9PELO|nr:hypothetical protein B9Z55_022112 [Caenorhabditis nigoni]